MRDKNDASESRPRQYVRFMKGFEIAPALEPDEWKHRRCGAVSLEHVDGETHVVVTDLDGENVSVSGVAEVFAGAKAPLHPK